MADSGTIIKDRTLLDGYGKGEVDVDDFCHVLARVEGGVSSTMAIWVIEPGHPIAKGIGEYIEIPKEEMYGERFGIPAPDELIFISWFEGGEVFRSGCCYKRGQGNIFYFKPGHETFPVYHQPEILQVISNSVRWAAKSSLAKVSYGRVAPLELIP
ncbi:trehalose utilization protein [Paenibacillus sp. PastF-1]|nr:trehalose utilization protein [Paenibacillus sp. PastF-2]MDF9848165.1 trehalose utilization protein [Paenibacillus sp. PastM-2]MDF9854882.1 trehalose utilization protein [Paenibacillus sp. PastF-1]MDH6480152.1 trehalose utilization protein [Paenibacillus sp. PastH-2]MDH6507583.1 trehalose utilization protein [Paenibacillus sp. PastM-3]